MSTAAAASTAGIPTPGPSSDPAPVSPSALPERARVVVIGGGVIGTSIAYHLAHLGEPDVLLLDMLLAGETGVALLNELRSHDDLATLPGVVCSSVELDQGQLAPFGVQVVLDKSHVTPTEIRAALRKVLA